MTLRTRLFLTSLAVALPLASALFLIDERLRLDAREVQLRRSVDADIAGGLRDRCETAPPRTGRPGRGGGAPTGPQSPDAPPRGVRPRDEPDPPGATPELRDPRVAPPPRISPPRRDPVAGPPNRRGAPPDGSGERSALPDGPGSGQARGGGGRGQGRGGSDPYEFFAYGPAGRPSADDAPPLPLSRDGSRASVYWAGTGVGVALAVTLGGDGPCAFLLARMPPPRGELRDQVVALLLVVMSVLAAAWIAAGPVISKLQRLAHGVLQSAASHYETPVAVDGGDEVAALGGAFNEAGRRVRAHLIEVQAREEALRGFVANTTHDVAIPLTVLQGHLAELDRDLADPGHRAHVRAAVQEAHYMASLVRNLGAATTLDEWSAAVVLAPVDVSALVERVVARHRPIARASGVELNVAVPDPPLIVPSDHTLLEQALNNLVDNAIRYNHSGGHVAVVLDRVGDAFAISVEDDGPGVRDGELAQLTKRWFRGSEARTRRPDGKGLGLAIATESVERLGLALTFTRPGVTGLRARIAPRAPELGPRPSRGADDPESQA